LLPSKWWTVRRVGEGPFLTPQSSQRHPACPLTHLDVRLQLGGYSELFLEVASFTGSAPETMATSKFLATKRASFARFHADHSGLVWLKRKRGY
jgi:hypothetical protein